MMSHQSQLTLLMIEDDDVDARGMERSFKKRRIANPIMRAHDGQEALELLEEGKVATPFIILLDLQMPRMNGLEFLAVLRNHEKLKSSVVFVLTTSQAEQDITAAYNQQIAGYFVKNEVGANFCEMLDMLEGYWRIAYLPQ
ncbi:MAG: CheY-like chemotaxis protein [Alteromonadaceae bacterium]|jgi:CheY-like chemotaxis protein